MHEKDEHPHTVDTSEIAYTSIGIISEIQTLTTNFVLGTVSYSPSDEFTELITGGYQQMALSPEEFVKRLYAISESDGIPYGRAQLLADGEQSYQQAVLQYKGYAALSDAFKCFFLETVELVNTSCRPKVTKQLSEFYGLFVPRLAHDFRSLCGAERVAVSGYPYHAYTLLRNTFDNVLLTSAALQKITDFYSIEGITPGKPLDVTALKKLRKDTEFDVRRTMTGSKSGLTQDTQVELAKWDALFDFEVHGARLSLASAMSFMKGQEPLPVVPRFEEKEFALFLNRYCEVAWMVHRLTPAIQPPGVPLPDEWKEKWRVLDDSFEITAHSLTKQLGKKIGTAIVELVKVKFPFNEKSEFPL
ncbi:hypothetical protein PPGU19_093100 (plasmid) [Paraburkholderia sp. PGU19]|uniref:hypothetical protein n=1 Tax=Paraburkholderia sp. PGU19 TaxID=2735434 RepID=UPI0015D9F795|nr:hypothetical protein [Paraburkholderia sp. PGU19]BCG04742.1 hypothetical protein PPGU19_093100 [Paraburkholderia sp. PGU19]